MPKSSYCLLNPNGGPLTVRVTVNNGIRLSATFILWELINGTWGKKEKFTIATKDKGTDEFILSKNIDDIENNSLAWSINSCSLMNQVDRGEFSIKIIQDKKDLWKKESSRLTPKCSDGKQLKFGSHVIFKHLIPEHISTSDLWKVTE